MFTNAEASLSPAANRRQLAGGRIGFHNSGRFAGDACLQACSCAVAGHVCFQLGVYGSKVGLTLRAAQRRASVGLAAFDAAERLEDALLVVGRDEQSPLYGITRRAVGEYTQTAAKPTTKG